MIGEKLGKYTLLEALGTGSMGTVYRGEDPDGRIVAVKLIRSQVLYDIERREGFLKGILAASLVRHDGMCPVLEIGDDNDDFFVVMPYIEGKTLEQYLEHKPIHWRRALEITHSVGEALSAAHATGAVHGALKPSNIWLRSDGTILVSDCSIARFTEAAKRAQPNPAAARVDFADSVIPLAALAYMSPEQIRGNPVDYRTDIFSLGAILYEMLTGRHPFDCRNSLSKMSAILEAVPSPLSSKLGSIPHELNRIVHRALAKESSSRYASMREFLTELEYVGKTAADARILPESGRRRGSRFVIRVAGIALIAALMIVLLACLLFFLPHP